MCPVGAGELSGWPHETRAVGTWRVYDERSSRITYFCYHYNIIYIYKRYLSFCVITLYL